MKCNALDDTESCSGIEIHEIAKFMLGFLYLKIDLSNILVESKKSFIVHVSLVFCFTLYFMVFVFYIAVSG